MKAISTDKSPSILIFILILSVSSLLGFPKFSAAEDKYWIAGTRFWDDPANWDPYGVPVSLSTGGPVNPNNIYLIQSDSTNRTVEFFTNYSGDDVGRVRVDATGTGVMTLSIQGGSRLPVNRLEVGYDGTGIINQTGGSVFSGGYTMSMALGVNPGSTGIYNLSEGSFGGAVFLSGTRIYGGQGIGVFNQTGGSVGGDSVSVYGITYNLVDGSLGGHELDVGGTINQTGGNGRSVVTRIYAGGTYNLSGTGNINASAGGFEIHSGGTFNQSGGSFVSGILNSGTLNLSGGRMEGGLGSLQNSGTFNYSGGELISSTYDPIINDGFASLTGSGTRTMDGNVINNGTFKTTHTTAQYTGTFTNNGAYISDPATQFFNNLTVGQSGYLVGQNLDKFFISGNFISNSIMNMDWNTRQAYLGFIGGTDHDFFLTGRDFGATISGYADNFAWGTLDITDQVLNLHDGNGEAGAALYLRELLGVEIKDLIIVNLCGFDGLDIYYMANLKENDYLGGLTYALMGGGYLRPAGVPEPATMLLLASGLVGLAGLRKKLRKS
jgi:hypothetical protein